MTAYQHVPRLQVAAGDLGRSIYRDRPRDVATALVDWPGGDVLDGRAAAWLRDVAAALDAGRLRR